MSGHVSALSMGMMGLGALVCVLIPLALLLYYRKKGADILPFFVGCGVFVVFALLLESLVHNLVLKALPVGVSPISCSSLTCSKISDQCSWMRSNILII